MKGGKAKEREEKVRRSRERVATEVNRLGLSIASTHTCARARTHAQGIYTGAGVGWNVCTQRATSMQCPYELVHR